MSVLASVIGMPISHSLSPAIHTAAFIASGRVGEYSATECSSEKLEGTLRSLREGGVVGVSVTMPLKEDVMKFVDQLSSDASFLRAVNCISFTPLGSIGHNTDGDGCCDALEQQGHVDLAGARVVVLGAGGTARSVSLALVRRGAHVVVVNRTVSRSKELVLAISALGLTGTIESGTETSVTDASVLINATSVGMNSEECPVSASVLHSGLTVLDAVYSPMETELLRISRDRGATAIDGLWMLIHQARHQQKLWFNEFPDAMPMRLAAERELSARRK